MMLDRLVMRHAASARRRADRFRDAGDWPAAAAGYRRWLALNPEDGPVWTLLGEMLDAADARDEAALAYAQASLRAPGDAGLLLRQGDLALRRDRPEEALAFYRRSHAIDANARAAEQIAALSPPEPEPEPAVVEEAPPPPVGAVQHNDHGILHGWLAPARAGDGVTFAVDGAIVARAWPDPASPRGDGFEFRTVLAIDHPVDVRATRMSDGAELLHSPTRVEPRPPVVDPRRRAWDARFVVVKPFAMPAGREVALFVTHSRTGTVKPHVAGYARALAEQGIAVLLVAVADRPLDIPAGLLDLAAGVIVRENAGYDFAAWAHAIALHPELYGAPTLYLVNDSVIGPPSGGRFGRMIARVRASGADVVGLTESHEYRWHVQSYFIALKARALSCVQLHEFLAGIVVSDDKDAVIRAYELPFAAMLENAGCRVEVLFKSGVACNPVLAGWRTLLDDDFPFVKLLLLRGAFPEVDTTGWRKAMKAAGFDIAVVDAVLRAGEEAVPRDPDDRLYAHPVPAPPAPTGPLKVALFGPWNYDNGLGAASRNLIGALRHAGVRLSLHPIEKPFHVHRPLAPPVAIRDFEGPADVAIVHLNPDSWHLLTDAQRVAIGAARRRVGYWVWEMGHIPDAWWHEFGSVDRIWAPSHYCARLFAAQDGAPVDVVPHPVALPVEAAPDADERAALLRAIGVDPARRTVLYVFDGSSYLVRKNPAALVRAFAAAGLAARGWGLVLKTKHLMDRPEDGRAFAEMVGAEAGVVLVDRVLPDAALARLTACADIYASPHASEGFGLTIAEAMAAGRPVVATDFGGSADLLDDDTGYPVRAHPWVLDTDHGHYTRGGEWARIDEPALAHALVRAADAIETGDVAKGQAARARVGEQLSFAAVGAVIAASLADTMIDRAVPRPPRPKHLNLRAGVPAAEGTGDPRVALVLLAADGSAIDDGLAASEGADWVAFAPAGSLLSPLFAASVHAGARARPDAGLFYGDDVAVTSVEVADQFRLKPAFDRTLLAAQDYVGAPVIVRADVLRALGGLDLSRRSAAIADLLFRADAGGHAIARIPEVLLAHPGERPPADPRDHAAMLAAQPALADYVVAPGLTPTSVALARTFAGGEPPVTIVIPTRRGRIDGGDAPAIEGLLDALERTDWPMDRLSVVVGDDIAGEADWAAKPRPYALNRIETPRPPGTPFNYAAKMNRLWREAQTEQIVFLNDDALPTSGGWLRALQTFAVDRGVGGVGARLLYPDGRLQHAGVVPHGSLVAHAWLGRRRARGTAHDWALVHREWSMVTGAVFATRRSLMEEVGGFDEVFTLEFNDIDLCLRLRALGYRIVCTPHAEMVHVEKLSRGIVPPSGDTITRFIGRWSGWLADDPAWHPWLRRDRFDFEPVIDYRQWYL